MFTIEEFFIVVYYFIHSILCHFLLTPRKSAKSLEMAATELTCASCLIVMTGSRSAHSGFYTLPDFLKKSVSCFSMKTNQTWFVERKAV